MADVVDTRGIEQLKQELDNYLYNTLNKNLVVFKIFKILIVFKVSNNVIPILMLLTYLSPLD